MLRYSGQSLPKEKLLECECVRVVDEKGEEFLFATQCELKRVFSAQVDTSIASALKNTFRSTLFPSCPTLHRSAYSEVLPWPLSENGKNTVNSVKLFLINRARSARNFRWEREEAHKRWALSFPTVKNFPRDTTFYLYDSVIRPKPFAGDLQEYPLMQEYISLAYQHHPTTPTYIPGTPPNTFQVSFKANFCIDQMLTLETVPLECGTYDVCFAFYGPKSVPQILYTPLFVSESDQNKKQKTSSQNGGNEGSRDNEGFGGKREGGNGGDDDFFGGGGGGGGEKGGNEDFFSNFFQFEGSLNAWHLAVFKNSLPALQYLVDHKIPGINERDSQKKTPLYYAVQQSLLQHVQVLLGSGADPNLGDEWNVCPLHLTSAGGDLRMARTLVEYGADVNALTLDLEPAVYAAWSCENGEEGSEESKEEAHTEGGSPSLASFLVKEVAAELLPSPSFWKREDPSFLEWFLEASPLYKKEESSGLFASIFSSLVSSESEMERKIRKREQLPSKFKVASHLVHQQRDLGKLAKRIFENTMQHQKFIFKLLIAASHNGRNSLHLAFQVGDKMVWWDEESQLAEVSEWKSREGVRPLSLLHLKRDNQKGDGWLQNNEAHRQAICSAISASNETSSLGSVEFVGNVLRNLGYPSDLKEIYGDSVSTLVQKVSEGAIHCPSFVVDDKIFSWDSHEEFDEWCKCNSKQYVDHSHLLKSVHRAFQLSGDYGRKCEHEDPTLFHKTLRN